jgi:hypothetical protein
MQVGRAEPGPEPGAEPGAVAGYGDDGDLQVYLTGYSTGWTRLRAETLQRAEDIYGMQPEYS